MKKLLLLFMFACAAMVVHADQPYAVYNTSGTTLTFYYGTKPSGAYSLNTGTNRPAWYSDNRKESITKVVFDSTFVAARPTSTYSWFALMKNLQEIVGLNYLNTSEVTDMSLMFYSCLQLTTLDLSHFNTSKVENMGSMFYQCPKLTTLNVSSFNTSEVTVMSYMFGLCRTLPSLNLSNFNTAKVTNMIGMFADCNNLASLNVSSFNTANVIQMNSMFSGCGKLTSVDVSHFNTSSVVNMESMFWNCASLTGLDLSSFNTANVTNMRKMFYNCQNVVNVHVGDNWNTDAVTESSQMFNNCLKIKGSKGTTYDVNHVDKEYARVDGGSSRPGYFSPEVVKYDLTVNDVVVTNLNCDDLSVIDGVSGTVTYDPSSNTLTLNNATLQTSTTNGTCITSNIDGLTITLKGNNSLTSETGIKATAIDLYNTTINGTGTLSAQGNYAGINIRGGHTLTIDGVSGLTASSSSHYGICASSPTNSRLVMKGVNTVVHAAGSRGAIRNMTDFVLEDGLEVIEPVGGYFDSNILRDADGNIAVQATIGKILTYDLWLNGVQVTSANASDLSVIDGVSGTVNFDAASNTLTLDNATLSVASQNNIKNDINGLVVNVVGTNTLEVTNRSASLQVNKSLTIKGTGSLNCSCSSFSSPGCLVEENNKLTIQDGVQVKFTGYFGMYGYSGAKLVMSGADTKLTAYGTDCSIYRMPATLNDGLAITQPAGAHFDEQGIVVINTWVMRQDVVISKPALKRGDLNGDGQVDVTDVSLLIDVVLGKGTTLAAGAQPDLNSDGQVDVTDVSLIIDIVLGKNV